MAHNVKLDSLSMDDLQSLIADAQAALAGKVEAERAELLKKLSALDAIGKPSKTLVESAKSRASPKPKYRSHANPEFTWVGRGGTPRWLKAEMAEKNLPLDAFLIK